MVQQRQGSFVGPMKVFEEHKYRSTRRGPGEKFDDCVEENPSRLFRRKFELRRNVGKEAAELRHQARHLASVIAESGSEGVQAGRLSHRGLEDFNERTERK